jgi:NADPH2:quinone reductase
MSFVLSPARDFDGAIPDGGSVALRRKILQFCVPVKLDYVVWIGVKNAGWLARHSPGQSQLGCRMTGRRKLNARRRIEKSMKAIQIKQTGGPEAMELVELPVPQPKANEAVVKLAASGVNFIDVYNREGRYKAPLPFVLGQEGAGTVTTVGTDVKSVKVGDRVAWTSVLGSYAEYAAVPADRLVPIPQGVSDQQAAATMLQGMTAHYLSHDTYPLKRGETALVHAAAGGVGLLLVQMAHNIGARVIATVSTEEKAKLAREAGADDIILYTQSDFEAETKRLMGGKGVDVVYDSVGKTTFEKGLNVLRPRGMMVLYGGSSGAVPPFDLIALSTKGSLYVTRPTLGHYTATREELMGRSVAVFGMIAAGKLKLRIEYKYPLAEAQRAHRDLEGRKTTGKLLLIP